MRPLSHPLANIGALAKPCCSLPVEDDVRGVSKNSQELSRAYKKENMVSISFKIIPRRDSNLPSKEYETTECGKMAENSPKSAVNIPFLGEKYHLVFTYKLQ